MQPVSFIVAALLGLAALAVVLQPLLRHQVSSEQELALAGETRNLSDREQNARQALQEVEFDFQLGNLAEPDYRALRTRYMQRALSEMKDRLQQEKELDAEIERELSRLKAASGEDEEDSHEEV